MDASETLQEGAVKSRGFWLTAFLILMFIANPLVALGYFGYPELMLKANPGLSTGFIKLLGAMAVVNTVSAIAVWNWKKWGVFAIYASTAIAFSINLYIGIGLVSSLTGVLGAVVIFFTTKSRWEFFS